MRRALAAVAGLLALLWCAPVAAARYLGTDLMGNIGPESQVGGLADRYPLSAYSLDYHVDGPSAGLGGVSAGDVPQLIAQAAAAWTWTIVTFAVKLVVDLFAWAFSLDLLGGASGALAPVGNAVRNIYDGVIGEEWLIVAILLVGGWAIWNGLMRRRYVETVGALGLSVAFVMIAMLFVFQPERTIGQASRWANDLSAAFLAGGSGRSPTDTQGAKRSVSDHLMETLVYRPWVVLEFGGLRHCVDTDRTDKDGFPTPVSSHDPTRDVCRDHVKAGSDGHGGYAPRFLRYAPGSDERNAEYEALKDGEAPDDPQFAGYPIDKADSPAVDIQQAGGAWQRLAVVMLIAVGAVGAILLLGMLSLVVILAQVIALLLIAFAPVALVVGVFPGRGHDFFRWWLTHLAVTLFIKVLYALVLGVVVMISMAVVGGAAATGFLFAFGLQAAFFWAIFLYRRRITERLVGATVGRNDGVDGPRRATYRRMGNAAERPFSALGGAAVAAPAFVGAYVASVVRKPPQETVTNDADDQRPSANGDGPTQDETRYDMAKNSVSGSHEIQETPERPEQSGLVAGALDTPDVPEAPAPAPGRLPSGELVDFRRLSDDRLFAVSSDLVGSDDVEAQRSALAALHVRHGKPEPQEPAPRVEGQP